MTRMTPDKEQEAIIQQMVASPSRSALNASLYGTGKTLCTVEVAGRLGGELNLIAAPKGTLQSWKHTILTQYPDAQVFIVSNSNKAGKEAKAKLLAKEPGWYIIGRELMLHAGMAPEIERISSSIDFLAFDECQLWSNRKSAGFKRMKRIKPKYRMALSATPFGNKFQNLYSIAKWLWPQEIPNSFWLWVSDWCTTEEDFHAGTVITGEQEPGAFVASLPCYARLEADFGEPRKETVFVELSSKERAIYDDLQDDMIAWLGANPLVLKFPHTLRQRLRQMTLGELHITEEGEITYPHDMKSTKYETLLEILDSANEPALIFTHSRKYAEVVVARMNEQGYKADLWAGTVSQTQREKTKQRFIDGHIDYIVATPGAIGEGTDGLQHRARMMVWLSRDDNNMLNEQAFRRLHRRGQQRTVLSIDIAAEDTYDEGQLSNLIEQAIAVNRSLAK